MARPPLFVDLTLDLNDPALCQFAGDPAQQRMVGPAPAKTDYVEVARRDAGAIAAAPLSLLSTRVEHYNVVQKSNGQVVGAFDAAIPIMQATTLSTSRHLLVQNTLSQAMRDVISTLFSAYDEAQHGDMWSYCLSKMASENIASDAFLIGSSYLLDKGGVAPTEDCQQRDALLRLYTDPAEAKLDIDGPDARLSDFLSKYRCVLVNSTVSSTPQERAKDAVHMIEGSPVTPPQIQAAIDIDWISTGGDCTAMGVTREQERIATILDFPEFKIEWMDTHIEIGCGARITVTVPRLYTRTSRIVLYAYVARATNMGGVLVTYTRDCLVKAAVTGAVVGVVMANFASALASFQSMFTQCIEYHAGQYIKCMAPGLVLATEPGAWH